MILLKAENLQKLKKHRFKVPDFIVVHSLDEYSRKQDFLKPDRLYAVRSSFYGEDGGENSFAGQFNTFLNVKYSDISSAICKVLASTNSAAVEDYREAKSLKKPTQGCVIIQEMVQAKMAGVVFTSNPNGALNEIVINVGYGLGENVVSDKVDTASYFYHKSDESFYREGPQNSPTLSDSMVLEIVKEANRAEEIFGCAIDMEFAIENDIVYFLQARPITTIDYKNVIILDNSNIVESYPGLSLPLTQDYVKTIYHEIFYNLLVRVTKNKKCIDLIDDQLKDMVDVANWRMYYRISNWYSVLQLMPFSHKIIPMWQKMMGVEDKSLENITPFNVSLGVKMQIIRSVLKYMRTIPDEMRTLNEKFEQKVVEYERKILNADTISELLQVYETIRADILQDWDLTLINDMYAFIYCHLAKKHGDLIADIKNIESMKPAIAMKNLLFIAKESGVDSDEYVSASNKYIAEYGDRCVGELKLETKTYRTNPELLDEYVINTLQNNPTGLTSTSKWGDEPKVTKDPKVVRKAKIGIANRESSRLNRSRLFGICRSIFLKIGQIMCSAHRIEKPEDVFYLHINELRIVKDHRELVANRKLEEVAFESIPAYSRLIFPGQVINKTNPVIERKILGEENHLCGIATSAGVVTGQVVIIKDVNKVCDLKDKIIVTKSTDPGWVFLVQQCAGIISEKGSLLSHTAIISRELYKPAVVNVKNCTNILRDGDVVQLDANNGVITIVERRSYEV